MSGSNGDGRIAARREDLRRIAKALDAATALLRGFRAGKMRADFKDASDPVKAADHAANELLLGSLLRSGEGWLSEESRDDLSRLRRRRVWVVDPLDGTREFLLGIPEWCVSVGLIEDGRAVAGGVSNPATGEVFLGSLESGLTVRGTSAPLRNPQRPQTAVVLASRDEVSKGKWDRHRGAPYIVWPMGSVAYRLACVAAELADATWTFDLRHEWDVAAGVALVAAAGGVVRSLDGMPLVFNRHRPCFEGFIACSPTAQWWFKSSPDAFRRPLGNRFGAESPA